MANGDRDGLRRIALVAAAVGWAGSLGFLFLANPDPPKVLAVLFVLWLAGPFAAVGVADRYSQRWSPGARTAMYWVVIAIVLVSFAVYGYDAVSPPKAQRAFVFVVIPIGQWAVLGMAIVAGVFSRKR